MFGGMVKLVAHDGRMPELMEFLQWDAEVARSERGTLRFDVWQVADEPNGVFLYEAYENEEAFRMHQLGEPFKKFMEDVVPNLIEAPMWIIPFADSAISVAH